MVLHQAQVLLDDHHRPLGLQGHGDHQGQLAVDVHIQVGGQQARGPGIQVVGVEGHVLEGIDPLGVGADLLAVPGNRVGQEQAGSRHGPAPVIGHPAGHHPTGSGAQKGHNHQGQETNAKRM